MNGGRIFSLESDRTVRKIRGLVAQMAKVKEIKFGSGPFLGRKCGPTVKIDPRSCMSAVSQHKL